MQKPPQDKSDHQHKKYQQRSRHGYAPEKKSNIHRNDILSDKDYGEAGYDKNQY
jgi:hypothetical protein